MTIGRIVWLYYNQMVDNDKGLEVVLSDEQEHVNIDKVINNYGRQLAVLQICNVQSAFTSYW